MLFKQICGVSTDVFWKCIRDFMHMNLATETKTVELMITEFDVLFALVYYRQCSF